MRSSPRPARSPPAGSKPAPATPCGSSMHAPVQLSRSGCGYDYEGRNRQLSRGQGRASLRSVLHVIATAAARSTACSRSWDGGRAAGSCANQDCARCGACRTSGRGLPGSSETTRVAQTRMNTELFGLTAAASTRPMFAAQETWDRLGRARLALPIEPLCARRIACRWSRIGRGAKAGSPRKSPPRPDRTPTSPRRGRSVSALPEGFSKALRSPFF